MATYYELTKGLTQPQLNDLQRRAESGGSTQGMNSQALSVYQYFQNQAKDRVIQAAQTGRELSAPNEWKNSIYNQYRPQTNTSTSPTPSPSQQMSQVPQPQVYQAPSTSNYEQYKYQSSLPTWDKEGFLQGQIGTVNTMYEQSKNAQLQQLQASRDKAVQNLNQQKSSTAPQYQAARNQADVVSAQNVQKLREMMAANGLGQSGENVSATVSANNNRQQAINDLNLQEQQINNQFDLLIAQAQDSSQDSQVIAQIESQRAQALLSVQQQAEQLGLSYNSMAMQDSQFAASHNASLQQAISNQQLQYDQLNQQSQQNYFNNLLNEAQVTGQYRGQSTLAALQQNFNNQLAVADLTGKYNGQPTMAAQQLAFQKEQFSSEKAWREYTYNNLSASEKAQLEYNIMTHGEEMAWRMFEVKANNQTAISNHNATLKAMTGR